MGVHLVLGYWTPETSGSLASYLECWISLSFGGEWNRKKNVFSIWEDLVIKDRRKETVRKKDGK